MTNREQLNLLTDKEFAEWVIYTAPTIGRNWTDSAAGIEQWLKDSEMEEKTADEMFEELGLVKIIERDSIVKYSKSDLGFKWELIFYSLNNTYEFRINHSVDNNLRKHHEPSGIDITLHKAITKQMEELGWL